MNLNNNFTTIPPSICLNLCLIYQTSAIVLTTPVHLMLQNRRFFMFWMQHYQQCTQKAEHHKTEVRHFG